jgi:hypothetical protein
MATAQRTKNTIVLRQDEMTAKVLRPVERPAELLEWGTQRDGRKLFRTPRLWQEVRVSYTLTQDQGMLEDLKQRATRNRSGTAVRGPATANAAGVVTVDLAGVPSLVRRAANLAGKKILDGPLVVTVKLLEQPEPAPLMCANCQQSLEAHEHTTKDARGMWVGGRTRGAHYEPDAERTDHYWYCQEVQA